MKIGIVINTSWNIYNFRQGLIRHLKGVGHEVIAIAPEDDYSDSLVNELGILFIPCAMQAKGTNPVRDFLLISQLRRIYKEQHLELVLHFTIKPNVYGSLAAARLGIPSICNVSGLGTVFLHDNPATWMAKQLYKVAFRKPVKVFFQNEFDRELFIEKGLINRPRTGLVRGSGIDLDRFQAPDYKKPDPFTFLMLARLLPDKGIREFVEATRSLKRQGLKIKSLIAGFSDFESKFGVSEDELRAWQEQGTIEYLGAIDNVQEIISNAGSVVLPSYREGLPKSLLEGAAMGKPLIATKVPGCSDVVMDGENGLLVEPRSPQDLARAMKEIANRPEEELRQMGIAGRRFVESNFSENRVIEMYMQTIESIRHNG